MFKIKNKELTFTHPHLQKEISWFYTICLCVREREGVCRFTCELYNPNLWRSKLIFSHYISSCQLAFPENTSTTAKKITNGCVFVCVCGSIPLHILFIFKEEKEICLFRLILFVPVSQLPIQLLHYTTNNWCYCLLLLMMTHIFLNVKCMEM